MDFPFFRSTLDRQFWRNGSCGCRESLPLQISWVYVSNPKLLVDELSKRYAFLEIQVACSKWLNQAIQNNLDMFCTQEDRLVYYDARKLPSQIYEEVFLYSGNLTFSRFSLSWSKPQKHFIFDDRRLFSTKSWMPSSNYAPLNAPESTFNTLVRL